MLMKSREVLYRNLDRTGETAEISSAQKEYLLGCKKEAGVIRSWQWFIMILFFGFWELGARAGFINAFVFSSPSRVAATIVSMAKDGSLWYHTGITLAETFFSFFLILVFGIGIAVVLWWNTRLSGIFEPYLVVLNSLPKSALAPVFIVWLGANMKTIIVAAVSVAVFRALSVGFCALSVGVCALPVRGCPAAAGAANVWRSSCGCTVKPAFSIARQKSG